MIYMKTARKFHTLLAQMRINAEILDFLSISHTKHWYKQPGNTLKCDKEKLIHSVRENYHCAHYTNSIHFGFMLPY